MIRLWMCVALAAGCAVNHSTDSLATPASGSDLTTVAEPVDDCQTGMGVGHFPSELSLPTDADTPTP